VRPLHGAAQPRCDGVHEGDAARGALGVGVGLGLGLGLGVHQGDAARGTLEVLTLVV